MVPERDSSNARNYMIQNNIIPKRPFLSHELSDGMDCRNEVLLVSSESDDVGLFRGMKRQHLPWVLGILLTLPQAIQSSLTLAGIEPHGSFSWVNQVWLMWLVGGLAAFGLSILVFLGVRRFRQAQQDRKDAQAKAHEVRKKEVEDARASLFWANQKAGRDTLERLKWLYYDWHTQYRFGKTDTLDDERAFQLIDQLIEFKVLDPSDRLNFGRKDFRSRLAKVIAEVESDLGIKPPRPAPL